MTDNETRIPIWLDTDPGVDDAMAMALLFALDAYDVKGVSAVAGNVELPKTFQNARDLVAFFGRKDVPVYPGAARPLFREPRTCYFIHGQNGLGDVPLPASDAPVEQQPAWDALYEAAKAADGELTLVAVAALIKPEIMTFKDLYVQVETAGDYCKGTTVGDWYGVTGKAPNASCILDIDRQGFVDLLVEAVKTYD